MSPYRSAAFASAQYLHNGSVPTLFHLLTPGERPAVFTKGRLEYDSTLVGYAWANSQASGKPDEGYRFDTSAHTSVNRSGHDCDVIDNGKTYKLDWSHDRPGVTAIIEYLKTK